MMEAGTPAARSLPQCSEPPPPADAVIVSYNTCELLRGCLRTLTAGHRGRIVVVDNCSTDGSPQMVRDEFPMVTLIEAGSNIGYGAAANIGVDATSSPTVAVLNADVNIDGPALEQLSAYLREHPDVAVVGPRLIDTLGVEQASCARWPTLPLVMLAESGLWKWVARGGRGARWRPFFVPPHDSRVDWLLGAVLVIRRAALGGEHPFDARFFLYFEEVDLCDRLHRAGWQTHWVRSVTAVHAGGAASSSTAGWANRYYFSSLARYRRRAQPDRRLWAQRALVLVLAAAKWSRSAVGRRSKAETRSWLRLMADAARGWA